MSNTICDNFCDTDKGLNLFKKLFGDNFIEAFYMPMTENPAFVTPVLGNGQVSLVSIMASNISMAALFMVGLIFFSGAMKWIFDSANDGEALGSKGSALGSVARPLFAIIMLMPTPSKFAVINIITIYFALWGHGFANKAYTELLVGTFDTGVLQLAESDDMLSRASDLSGAVFSGALSAYCAAYVNDNYDAKMSMPIFTEGAIVSGRTNPVFASIGGESQSGGKVHKPTSSFGKLFDGSGVGGALDGYKIKTGDDKHFKWVESDASGDKKFNSAGAICGEITFNLASNPMPASFGASEIGTKHWAARRLAFFAGELNSQMSAYKYGYAQEAFRDGVMIAQGNPAGLSSFLALPAGEILPWTTKLDLGSVEADVQDQVASEGTTEGTGGGGETPADGSTPAPAPEPQTGGGAAVQVADGQQIPSPKYLIIASNYHTDRLKTSLRGVLTANGFDVGTGDGNVAKSTLNCGSPVAQGPQSTTETTRGPSGEYESTMCAFLSEIYSGGWINAAPAREKIKQYKMSATGHILDPSFSYSSPGYLATNATDENQTKIANMFQSAMSAVRRAAVESIEPKLSTYSSVITDGVSDLSFSGAVSAKSGIMDKLDNAIVGTMFSLERSVIEFATGTGEGDDVDALTRMQDFGVGLMYVTTAYDMVSFKFKAAFTTARFACSLTPGLIKSFAYDCGSTVKAGKMGFDILFSDTFDSWMRYLGIVAAYFTVFIPTMPFVFLLMAAIGWFIQVFQTLVGMPLWAIMHSIPGGDFIGGQQHGYFALISLFFRPLIIVVGFFLAFELYDPVITLLVQGYFDMHHALIMSDSSFGLFAAAEMLQTWVLHLLVLANLILAATYLVFGLIQELSDTTLEFMGTRVFAGFGNQETKSVAQGSAQTFGSAKGVKDMGTSASKKKLKADHAADTKEEQKNAITNSDPSMPSGGNPNASATGANTNGPGPGDGGGAGAGGGGAGGGAGGGGGASPYEINRPDGYNPETHSSMVKNVPDSAVQSAMAKADKKETFGGFGNNKASAAGREANQSATQAALAGGSSKSEAKAIGKQAGKDAKSAFTTEAQAGHDERMDALRSGNERGYNAMYQKHSQEGVAGVDPLRQDAATVASRDTKRYGGDSAKATFQRQSMSGAIDQAVADAGTIPDNRSART